MSAARAARVSLLPLLFLAGGSTSHCDLSTDSGTGELRIVGTVRFVAAGSGCWRVETHDGRFYELSAAQAPAAVLHDGARVLLVVQPDGEQPRTCPSGMPVVVREVMSVDGD